MTSPRSPPPWSDYVAEIPAPYHRHFPSMIVPETFPPPLTQGNHLLHTKLPRDLYILLPAERETKVLFRISVARLNQRDKQQSWCSRVGLSVKDKDVKLKLETYEVNKHISRRFVLKVTSRWISQNKPVKFLFIPSPTRREQNVWTLSLQEWR